MRLAVYLWFTFTPLILAAQELTTVRAGRLIDGTGAVRRDVIIEIRRGRIVSVTPAHAGAGVTYDLRDLTVMPGLIDTHVHLDSHFGPSGRATNQGENAGQRQYAARENAYAMLRAGYTTVQSLGSDSDLELRDLIARDAIPGPRLLTSLNALSDTSLTPEQIRVWVRERVQRGADLLKVFASKSIREGGAQTLSDVQIAAACEEAKALGKRIWVHAHAASAVRAAANAGCWAVTHGSQVTDAELALMAEKGTYFEPNIGLVTQNYIENKQRFLGIGNYDEAGFRFMEEGISRKLEMFRRAVATKGLRVIMGTDATAGAHGQNARETIYRVDTAGQGAMDAIVQTTAGNARALGMADSLGVVRVGMIADLVAVGGNPLERIRDLRDVRFVMKGGKVYRTQGPDFSAGSAETKSAGVSFTTAGADIDKDGDLDVFVGLNGAPNRLYRNDGGRMTDVALALGVASTRPTRAAAWGDYDGDGDADLLVGYTPGGGSVLALYRNDPTRFADVTSDVGLARDSAAVRQLSFIDVDSDGDLDLFVAFRDKPNALFENVGGEFTDVAAAKGLGDPRKSVGAVWFDYDEDGDLDLYVANMDGDANGLYRNDGGSFRDVADQAGVAWGGRTPRDAGNGTVRPCAADVNNDGHIDLFTANYGKPGLFLNRGGGRFEATPDAWGVAYDARYDACAFGDFDNDGTLDLYLNGTVTGGVSYRDFLYKNVGNRFIDVTPDSIGAQQGDHGVQWLDLDSDGDLDLWLTGSAPNGMQMVWRNDLTPSHRSVMVSVGTRSGGSVPGAEVRVFVAGTRRLVGTRLVDTGSGYDAQNDGPVHVGVPAGVARVDVEVTVLRGGKREIVRRRGIVPTGQVLRITPSGG